MSTVIKIGYAVVAVALAIAWHRISRARRRTHRSRIATAIRRWRQRHYDYGPNANALFADIDQHLTQALAEDPELFAGLIRLQAAIDNPQEGGTP